MSGIILPGKDNDKKSGGSGIELPKGFSRRRVEEEQASTPAPEEQPPIVETPLTPETPAATGGRQRGRGADLLFPPTGAQVQCPACGTPYTVPIFSIIDLGANPELGPALLGGQINVAVCPNCGTGGALNAPLMVHSPEHSFLGVYVPATGVDDVQRQKIIGDLTQALMRRLPTEARRGYMLQPKEYLDWNRFVEKLWEFQGVTPEMLRRQRDQMAALQSLMRLADDRSALQIALERHKSLIDRQLFALLERLMILTSTQGDQESATQLSTLRTYLLENTESGKEIKELQDRATAAVRNIKPGASRADVLAAMLDAWQGKDGREIASAIAISLAPMLDYQFLLTIAERLETEQDLETRAHLEALRNLVQDIQEQQRASAQNVAAQSQEVLQAVLESTDIDATLREYADYIDENFLGVLAASIEQAGRSKATAAARRLKTIYDKAVSILEEQMAPDVRLINQLLNAPDAAAQRKLLESNRDVLSKEFVSSLRELEKDFRDRGATDVADRLKSIRGQAALML
ncbi:MAG: CpXC domain-containing protein [Caldilineaceae bacterium]|nr:CpXC domain-containing protein [Caldilineaceae bacterium]